METLIFTGEKVHCTFVKEMNNNGFVTVNGILQGDGSYYITNDYRLIFGEAPPKGSNINVIFNNGNTNSLVLSFHGNGSQNVFPIDSNQEIIRFNHLMTDITKHKDNPAVKDLLEQLRVVTELLR